MDKIFSATTITPFSQYVGVTMVGEVYAIGSVSGSCMGTSDYGIWQIMGDEVIQPVLPPEVKMCSGYISCTESILVVAGYYSAARLEDNNLDILINRLQAEGGNS